MKTAVELVKKCQDRMKSIRDKIENKRKSKKVYSEDDLRNAYRWGITASIGTSDHFEEFVNNIKL
jgi:ABC-type Fe3+-hydroxamate transport system substrate-binding protein